MHTPVDICCIIDISGSMDSEATLLNEEGNLETFGFSILDLVKHAVKTIINNLGEKDRLSIVSYHTTATVVFDLMHMDA